MSLTSTLAGCDTVTAPRRHFTHSKVMGVKGVTAGRLLRRSAMIIA